jgi:hypothetical protein
MGTHRHDATPKPGTLRSQDSGKETDGKTPALYPLTGTCQSCNTEIRLTAYQGAGWTHTAAPRPAKTAAGDAERGVTGCAPATPTAGQSGSRADSNDDRQNARFPLARQLRLLP